MNHNILNKCYALLAALLLTACQLPGNSKNSADKEATPIAQSEYADNSTGSDNDNKADADEQDDN